MAPITFGMTAKPTGPAGQGDLSSGPLIVESPFSSPIVEITFREGKLSVHQAYLNTPKLSALIFSAPGGQLSAHMKDTPLDVGHVLIRWLYSGNYGVLNKRPGVFGQSSPEDLKIAFGVYSVAREYGLTGLQTIATGRISQLKMWVDIGTFIDVIEEAYPRTVGKDPWVEQIVAEYINEAMKQAKAGLPPVEPRAENDNVPLSKLIIKGLLSACREAMMDVTIREAALAKASKAKVPKKNGGNRFNSGSLDEQGPDTEQEETPRAVSGFTAEPPAPAEAEITVPDNNDWVMASPHPHDQLEAELAAIEKAKKAKKLKPTKKKKKEPVVTSEPQPTVDREPEPELQPESEAAWVREPEPATTAPVPEPEATILPDPETTQEGVAETGSDLPEGNNEEIRLQKKQRKIARLARKREKRHRLAALEAELAGPVEGMPDQAAEPAPEPEVESGPQHVAAEDGFAVVAKVKKPKKKKEKEPVSWDSGVPEERLEEEVVIFTPVHDWDS